MDEVELTYRLAGLRSEHADLGIAIAALSDQLAGDQIPLARLKKRKLMLKDVIARAETMLIPDIVA